MKSVITKCENEGNERITGKQKYYDFIVTYNLPLWYFIFTGIVSKYFKIFQCFLIISFPNIPTWLFVGFLFGLAIGKVAVSRQAGVPTDALFSICPATKEFQFLERFICHLLEITKAVSKLYLLTTKLSWLPFDDPLNCW